MTFQHVFEPLTIRHLTLRSRINFGAHTANMAVDGVPGERHIAYYRERALGGAGMIVVEPVPVHRTAVLTRGNFRHGDDSIIPAFRRLTDACREAGPGVVMIQQLYHVGQHGDADNSFAPNWSPSGLPSYHDADGSHAMTGAEIEEVIAGFISAADRASRSGFDGIEVFAAYHALVDQFWTPWSNRRTDEWGATAEDRMRLSARILAGIREACGEDFIVGLAINVDPESEATLSLDEVAEIVAWHDERRLMDYVTCGTGSYFDFYKLMPTSLYPQRLGAPVRRAPQGGRPACSGPGREPHPDPRGGRSGDRGRTGRHGEHRARPDRRSAPGGQGPGRPSGRRAAVHLMQPAVLGPAFARLLDLVPDQPVGRARGRVGRRSVRAGGRARSVLVVGGGPAGLEAARVAAERGHRVTLAEGSSALGGQFRLAGLQPSRGQITDLLGWYARRLEALGVDVRLGVEMRAEDVAAAGADEVIVATGSRPPGTGFQRARPMVDRLPGADDPSVTSIQAVLDGSSEVGRRVLVLDDLGDWRGLGTALHLAELGHTVTILTAAPVAGGGLFHSAADVPLRQRYARAGGQTVTQSTVLAWRPTGATVQSTLTGATSEVPADTLVIAEAPVAVTALADALTDAGVAFHQVGDCVAPRRASLAFYEARELARRL